MRIGFDAKRLFQNFTGLGNYARAYVSLYHESFPADQLYLFTPGIKADPRTAPFVNDPGYHVHMPSGWNPFWRMRGMTSAIRRSRIELYHGLSHELPFGIARTGVASVVTIHDLIFHYYPGDYSWFDRQVYSLKWKHACTHADHIIAISEQTKKDIILYYQINPDKITVIYQDVDPLFQKEMNHDEIESVKEKYQLPAAYHLYVGSVISRKNLLGIIEAMNRMDPADRLPLVIIGQGRAYKERVVRSAERWGLSDLLIWLGSPLFADFPAIYKGAMAMIYPSFHEGYGLPVAEALQVGTPVITSNQSSLPEAGGDAALLVNPASADELAAAMLKVQADAGYRDGMIRRGLAHMQKMKADNRIQRYRDVYERVLAKKTRALIPFIFTTVEATPGPFLRYLYLPKIIAMRPFYMLLISFLLAGPITAQDDITVFERKEGGKTIIVARNTGKIAYHVTIEVTSTGMTVVPGKKVEAILPAGFMKDMATLEPIPGESWKYSYSVAFTEAPDENIDPRSDNLSSDPTPASASMKKDAGPTLSDAAIIVYTKPGCGRCSTVKRGLDAKGVTYQEIDVSKSSPEVNHMWQQVRASGFSGTSVTMPVVRVNGEYHYNIKDLEQFVKEVE